MKKILPIIAFAVFLIVGYFILDSLLFDGVKSRSINQDGFQADYFALDSTKNKPAVVLIGGGYSGEYWGSEFAKRGFVGLSLPYTGKEGLPNLPEDIPLEYFEKAGQWLKIQPEVDPNKIIVMGASRNAELTLVIASTFPEMVSGAVAFAPSSVSWSNTVIPYNSDDLKPSWTYRGKAVPFIAMEKLKGSTKEKLDLLTYWNSGLGKSEFQESAAIKVERINGPILLFSGKDDAVWPSVKMANRIEQRLEINDFAYSFQNIQYENAGHLISRNPENDNDTKERFGKMRLDGKDYTFSFGGTQEGDNLAKKDAKKKVILFLERLE